VLCARVDGGLMELTGRTPELAGIVDVGGLLADGMDASAVVSAAMRVCTTRLDEATVDFAPPILRPGKIICVGINYRDHANEGGRPAPAQPVLFAKFSNTIIGARDPIVANGLTNSLDYEGELGVVIGRRAAFVSPDDAAGHIAGYCVANDVSARDLQHGDPASQWLRGKSLDGFAPLGPYFVTADTVADWRQLVVRTWVNGELRQDCACGQMIFGVEELISFVSHGITLDPGDVILTGTPAGVGLGFDPPRWLIAGDLVEIEITGLGRQRTIVKERSV
jgi:acylpyruvate hydrolase